jgi:hypothetical protein
MPVGGYKLEKNTCVGIRKSAWKLDSELITASSMKVPELHSRPRSEFPPRLPHVEQKAGSEDPAFFFAL